MTRRALAAAVSIAAILSSPAQAQPTPPPPLEQRLRAACASLRAVDRRRLPPAGEVDRAGVEAADAMRGAAALPPAGHAGPLVRLVVHQSRPGFAPHHDLLAWKAADGSWLGSRVFSQEPRGGGLSAIFWPHEPGIDLAGLPDALWVVVAGRLAPEAGVELEAILASRCLQREPPVRPHVLPLRGGGERICHWHPVSYRLEIGGAGPPRTYSRSCTHYDPGGGSSEPVIWASDLVFDLVAGALDAAAPVPPRPPVGAATVPAPFHGRWAQRPEDCTGIDALRLDVAADALTTNAGANPVSSVDVRGPRTAIVRAAGPGFVRDVPAEDLSMPLLLSPEGARLAVVDPFGGYVYQMGRCA
jgi:hypothetical protein